MRNPIQKATQKIETEGRKHCVCYDADNQMCMDLYGFGRRWQSTDFCSYGRIQDEPDQQRDFNSRV